MRDSSDIFGEPNMGTERTSGQEKPVWNKSRVTKIAVVASILTIGLVVLL